MQLQEFWEGGGTPAGDGGSGGVGMGRNAGLHGGIEVTGGVNVTLGVGPDTRLLMGLMALPASELERSLTAWVQGNPYLEWEPAWEKAVGRMVPARPVTAPVRELEPTGARMLDDEGPLAALSGSEARRWRLVEQVPCTLTREERRVAYRLVAQVDDLGYSTADAATVAAEIGCAVADVERVRAALVRELEPAGVLSRDWHEFAAVWCGRLDLPASVRDDVGRALAAGFDHHARRAELAQALGMGRARARAVASVLSRIPEAPWPLGASGSSTSEGAGAGRDAGWVHPDLLLTFEAADVGTECFPRETDPATREAFVRAHRWCLLPALPLPVHFVEAVDPGLVGTLSRGERDWLRERRYAAHRMLRALRARQETLLRVGAALVADPGPFLVWGAEAITPTRVEDLAGRLGLHPATVWRALQDKWLLTPRGLLPLRAFVGRASQEGVLAPAALAGALRACLAEEDPNRPLTDGELAVRLYAKGMPTTRRTVAKYRAMLGIAPARRRMGAGTQPSGARRGPDGDRTA